MEDLKLFIELSVRLIAAIFLIKYSCDYFMKLLKKMSPTVTAIVDGAEGNLFIIMPVVLSLCVGLAVLFALSIIALIKVSEFLITIILSLIL